MKLFIKKWWLLKNLRKEIIRHSVHQSVEQLSTGRQVLLSRQFFIAGDKQTPEFPGLAEKWLWWRKKYSCDKLKRRIKEYNDIFSVCVEEGYINMEDVEKEGIKMQTKMPSTATSKAHKISGYDGLIERLLSEYQSIWLKIVLPILGFIVGYIIKDILKQL